MKGFDAERGMLRLQAEAERIAEMRDRAGLSYEVSVEIIPAFAGGHREAFVPVETVMTENGPRIRPAAFPGSLPLRRSSGLDRIERERVAKSRKDGEAPLFTAQHHNTAERYAGLVEAVAGQGAPRSFFHGLTTVRGSGGREVDLAALHIAERRGLAAMRRAIGRGVVLAPRGVLAHAGRITIRADRLVDAVCLASMTPADVLRAAGWTSQTRYRRILLSHLLVALNKMADA